MGTMRHREGKGVPFGKTRAFRAIVRRYLPCQHFGYVISGFVYKSEASIT